MSRHPDYQGELLYIERIIWFRVGTDTRIPASSGSTAPWGIETWKRVMNSIVSWSRRLLMGWS